MTGQTRRKELKNAFRDDRSVAGVYRIVNVENGRYLLGSSPNPNNVRSKLEFSRSTNTTGALDRRIQKAVAEFGIGAFSFEVLETLTIEPAATDKEIQADLHILEALWREKLDPALSY